MGSHTVRRQRKFFPDYYPKPPTNVFILSIIIFKEEKQIFVKQSQKG